MSLAHLTAQIEHGPARCPALRRNSTPVQARHVPIWHSREEALRARDDERRGQAEAILREHGTLKHEYLASVLGVSRQRVAKGLRDGFTPEQMAKLGVAGSPVAKVAA